MNREHLTREALRAVVADLMRYLKQQTKGKWEGFEVSPLQPVRGTLQKGHKLYAVEQAAVTCYNLSEGYAPTPDSLPLSPHTHQEVEEAKVLAKRLLGKVNQELNSSKPPLGMNALQAERKRLTAGETHSHTQGDGWKIRVTPGNPHGLGAGFTPAERAMAEQMTAHIRPAPPPRAKATEVDGVEVLDDTGGTGLHGTMNSDGTPIHFCALCRQPAGQCKTRCTARIPEVTGIPLAKLGIPLPEPMGYE